MGKPCGRLRGKNLERGGWEALPLFPKPGNRYSRPASLGDCRKNYSHNDEVWRVRERWSEIKPQLQHQPLTGCYRFSPLRRIHRTDDHLEIWSALDSLVLKAIAIVFTKRLVPRLSTRCTHLAGNGGAKSAVREVVANLPNNQFVFRTDVKSYYSTSPLFKVEATKARTRAWSGGGTSSRMRNSLLTIYTTRGRASRGV